MIRQLRSLPFRAHRAITLGVLRRLSRRGNQRPPYTPLPGSMLYVAASCLPYHISGYTTRTHELLRAMTASGADVHALTRPGYPWDRSDRLAEPEPGITCFDTVQYAHERRPSKHRLTLHYAVQAAPVIMRRAVETRAGLIHAASNHVNALPALLAARRLGIPFQYEMRGLWELSRTSRQPGYEHSPDYALGLELEGLAAAQADRVLVISEQLGRYAARVWNIAPERIALLPNCVDAERIRPDPACESMPNTIGYAGSLVGYEGLDTLIEAVGMLAADGQGPRLEIIGDGEARPELERLVERLNLAERVRLRGRVAPEASRAMLAACALVCIPRKPFAVCAIVPPIKLVEALAMAKAVIVPDLPVFRDELGVEAAGLFFKAGDAADLARVISGALADPRVLAALGARARAYALARRQWREYAAEAARPVLGSAAW